MCALRMDWKWAFNHLMPVSKNRYDKCKHVHTHFKNKGQQVFSMAILREKCCANLRFLNSALHHTNMQKPKVIASSIVKSSISSIACCIFIKEGVRDPRFFLCLERSMVAAHVLQTSTKMEFLHHSHKKQNYRR